MSISSTASATTGSNVAPLEQQLKADKKILSDDTAKKASQETLNADQARVTADDQAIAEAGKDRTSTGPASGSSGATPTGSGSSTGIDITI